MEELVQKINTAEILGVLERIQKVNYMISIHQLHGETSIVKQYERQREDFLQQLQTLLAGLQIEAKLKAMAA
jgi:hypothetical protein